MSESAIKIGKARGRPMLTWVGKKAVSALDPFPAQQVEAFDLAPGSPESASWGGWPPGYPHGGLLFEGDNKDVLVHLIANGFRGKVDLIYIDPPFDSGANYVRTVQLRGDGVAPAFAAEEYGLAEQVQYTDIWANDSYLQFMYERLILLKELLRDGGSIWLHCDWHKSHHLRCLMDEVFGAESLQNEIVWQRTDPHNDAKSRMGNVHDTLYWYSKGGKPFYDFASVAEALSDAALKEYSLMKLHDSGDVVTYKPELEGDGRRFKLDDCTWKGNDPARRFDWHGARPSDKRSWPHATPEEMDEAVARGEFYLRNPERGAARCRVSYLDERDGQVLQSIWTAVGRMKGGSEYPTEKPRALLARIVQACSKPGDLVLDCFAGSGPTLLAAQELGRRWIGSDLNRGAIQRVTRDMIRVLERQAGAVRDEDAPPPAQLSFTKYRINDYNFSVDYYELAALALERVGAVRAAGDSYFDGTRGEELVKVIDVTQPLTPAHLEEIRDELQKRPNDVRDVKVVCLRVDAMARTWLEEWNRLRKGGNLNRIDTIELRNDPRYGGLIEYVPATARIGLNQVDDECEIVLEDYLSPSILRRLAMEEGPFRVKIPDFRAQIDQVLIDPDYDGSLFRPRVVDAPEDRASLVAGTYRIPASERIAVKVIDTLGEEVFAVVGRVDGVTTATASEVAA